MRLRRFQTDFIKRTLDPVVKISVLSMPRGNGKSFLAAHLIVRAMTPGDPMFQAGNEIVQCAGSIDQARAVFGFVRAALEGTNEYRWIDSVTRLGATHKETRTKLRIISSNGKTAMGLINVSLAVADEPGSWELAGGELMWTALTGALGKPGSPLRIVVIGTLAPAATGAGHWYWDLVRDGTKGSTYVHAIQGEIDGWDQWATIRKANPLTAISADFRAQLLEERDAARLDSRLKARFLSYRLNVPSADTSEILLTTDDWKAVEARAVPEAEGRPVVGVDLGGGRAWSAACAIWPSGRTEALAVAPGIPDLESQEKRDRVSPGTYQRLYDRGQLAVSEGLQVQPPSQLWASIRERWGKPRVIICDRFRLAELQDAVKGGARIEPRVTRWSEAAFDIRALRKQAKDGNLSVDVGSRLLMATSLSRAMVQNDDQGSTRLMKRGTNNTARDDVASALVLCSGAVERLPKRTGTVNIAVA